MGLRDDALALALIGPFRLIHGKSSPYELVANTTVRIAHTGHGEPVLVRVTSIPTVPVAEVLFARSPAMGAQTSANVNLAVEDVTEMLLPGEDLYAQSPGLTTTVRVVTALLPPKCASVDSEGEE